MQEQINNLPPLDSTVVEEITRIYNLYVPKVSAKGHAGSLELGLFAYQFANAFGFKNIVDLGSGFTSAVFRLYMKNNPDVKVISVDDNADWLKKTRAFLEGQQLNTDNLELWDNFKTTSERFDLVLYDLGRILTRIENIDKPFELLAPNGKLILDDAHFNKEFSDNLKIKPPYLADVMAEALKRLGFSHISLKPQTNDCFGRYARLAWKELSLEEVAK